jgi:hypothetical protein
MDKDRGYSALVEYDGKPLVSEKPGTLELRELSMRSRRRRGWCCWWAARIRVSTASDPEIADVVTGLRQTWKVESVAPGHCTGEPAFSALKSAFGDRYLYAGLGTQLKIAVSSAAQP